MATTEPTDQTGPHPGEPVYIEDLSLRNFSDASNTSTSSSKSPFVASSVGTTSSGEGTSRDDTSSGAQPQKQQGVDVRDFATMKASGKPKGTVEQSR
jgi:hypothetical protein